MPTPVNRNPWRRVYSRAREAVARLVPRSCIVCRTRAADFGLPELCDDCRRQLPWNSHACIACALPLPADAGVPMRCGRCLRRPPPLDACHAAFLYSFPLDRLLPAAKFHGDLAASRVLAGWMAASLRTRDGAAHWPDAVVPVPLAGARLRQRGYDQALELARPLAGCLRLPVDRGLLARVRDTAPQSRLDAAGRRRNLRGAFRVRAGTIPPAHVALVDDVMTTGATLHAAAIALRRAGVARVEAWVCARVP